MENQHKKIKTYRDLTQEEIDLMNEIKDLESQVSDMCKKVATVAHVYEPLNDLYEARTKLQIGFMLLVRAVARPDSPWEEFNEG